MHGSSAAAGDVGAGFWRRIYNPVDAYGGEVITGWITRLYPYLKGDGTVDEPNPLLRLPIDEPRNATVDDRYGYQGPGIRSSQVPAVLSKVIVNVADQTRNESRIVALHAGLVGIAQDDNGALLPVAGWHVTAARVEIDDVIDRIVRDHQSTRRSRHACSRHRRPGGALPPHERGLARPAMSATNARRVCGAGAGPSPVPSSGHDRGWHGSRAAHSLRGRTCVSVS